jgi:hypothetical protein
MYTETLGNASDLPKITGCTLNVQYTGLRYSRFLNFLTPSWRSTDCATAECEFRDYCNLCLLHLHRTHFIVPINCTY